MSNICFLPPKSQKRGNKEDSSHFQNQYPRNEAYENNMQSFKQHEIDHEYYETTQSECEIIKVDQDQSHDIQPQRYESSAQLLSRRNSSANSLTLAKMNQVDMLKQQNASFRSYYAQVKQRLKSSANNSLSRTQSDQSQIKNLKSFQNQSSSQINLNISKITSINKQKAIIDLRDTITRIFRMQYKHFFEAYRQKVKENEILELFSAWQSQFVIHNQEHQPEFSQQDFDDINSRKLSIEQITERGTKRFSVNPLFSDQSAATLNYQKSLPGMIIQSNSQNILQSFQNQSQHQQPQLCHQDTFRQNLLQQQQSQSQIDQLQLQSLLQQVPLQYLQNIIASPQQQNQANYRNQVQTPQLAGQYDIQDSSYTSQVSLEKEVLQQVNNKLIEQLTRDIKKQVLKSLQKQGLFSQQQSHKHQTNKKSCFYQCQQSLQESFLTDENSSIDSNQCTQHKKQQKQHPCSCQLGSKQCNQVRLQDISNVIKNHSKCKDCSHSLSTTSTREQISPRLLERIKSLLPSGQSAHENKLKRSACIQTDQEQQQIITNLNSYYQSQKLNSNQGSIISLDKQNILQQQQNHFIQSMKSSQSQLSQQFQMQTMNQDRYILQAKGQQNCTLEGMGTATFRHPRDDNDNFSVRNHYQAPFTYQEKQVPFMSQRQQIRQQPKIENASQFINEETQRSIFSQSRFSKNQQMNDNSRYNQMFTSNNQLLYSQEEFIISPRNEDLQLLDATTKAQKDITTIDPAGDLSLVMYNTGTKNDFQKDDDNSNHDNQEDGFEHPQLNEQHLKTLSMFEAGFKTFFPQNQFDDNNTQTNQIQEETLQKSKCGNGTSMLNQHDQSVLGGVTSAAVSRYFNDECDDISEIRGNGFNGYQSQVPMHFKRSSLQPDNLYFDDQFSPHSNNFEMINYEKNLKGPTPKYSGIEKKCLVKKPFVRNDDCSFEYSKADDMPTHLLNDSSFDQLITDMEQPKSKKQSDKELNRVPVPKLDLEKIEQIKKEKAKEALKDMVFNSIGL